MNRRTDGPSGIRGSPWILPAVQVATTLAILALPIGSVLKLVAFAAIWIVTFSPLSARELVGFVVVCALFSVMDIMAVRQGAFAFSHADLAGLPIWEFFMWGFLVLHMLRSVGGPPPTSRLSRVLPLATLFAVPFSTISDPTILLPVSAALLGVAIGFLHDPWDIRYIVYAVLLGAAFEYVGVWSDQWHYPGNPVGGVEPWFATMWAGIGLFARRLVLPLIAKPAQEPVRQISSASGL